MASLPELSSVNDGPMMWVFVLQMIWDASSDSCDDIASFYACGAQRMRRLARCMLPWADS
jgi:hypothetical protein